MYGAYEWDDWYSELSELAAQYGENVSDEDAWREEFEAGSSPSTAFFGEYPEHAV